MFSLETIILSLLFLFFSWNIKVLFSLTTKTFKIFLLKCFVSLGLSFICFYFFETPFLLETAFAEESLNEDSSENTDNQKDKIKSEESTLTKVKTFIWDYKWAFVVGLVVIGTLVTVFTFSGDGNAGAIAAEAAAQHFPPTMKAKMDALALDSTLPKVMFFEDLPKDLFTRGTNVGPANFIANNYEVFAAKDINLHSAIIISPDTLNVYTTDYAKGTIYYVYTCKPILHGESVAAVIGNEVHYVKTFNVAENTFGWSHDPASAYWIKEAAHRFPQVANVIAMNDTSVILGYQKVVLVDVTHSTYDIYHKVDIRTIPAKALYTQFETAFQYTNSLRSFFMKDNEAGWTH